MTVSGSDAPRLIVDDLSGTRVVLAPGEDLTVGRMGRVVVGEDDAHMHRVLLVFWSADGVWWMGNEGTRLTVSVETRGERSISQSRLGPGASLPLPPGESAVVFATATSAYEIRVAVTGRGVQAPEPVVVGGRPTVGTFSPNLDQVALLTALVEPLLRLPAADVTEVPSVAQLEDRLGWTKKKVNTKIDYLCRTLDANGGPGFSTPEGNAPTRRLALARFALENFWSLGLGRSTTWGPLKTIR